MSMVFDTKILHIQEVEALTPFLDKLNLIPKDVSESAQVIVFGLEKRTLLLLTTNNFPLRVKKVTDELIQLGYKFELYYTSAEGFAHAFGWYEKHQSNLDDRVEEEARIAQVVGKDALSMIVQLYDARSRYSASDFVVELVRLAFQAGASDLHLQSEKGGVFIKVRIDGVLHDVISFTHEEYQQYLAKIKFLSGIKMNINKVPQDGRFQFDTTVHGDTESVDVRVNTLPGLYYDGVVMRYLEGSQSLDSFIDLGFSPKQRALVDRYLLKKHGMIFVTGPTGSGKTTTLYTMLDSINSGDIKIITLEDPIEYQLGGIQQSQINAKDGYTYEQGLKAVLRHDPDVILVGETRSLDTADTIVNAALTGHLVLTTVHTNSALETISRLTSMGVKTFLLAPAIQLICAQRLVRKLCPHCLVIDAASSNEKKEMYMYLEHVDTDELDLGTDGRNGTLPRSVGCERCNHTGFKGRIGVFELLPIDDGLRNMIIDLAPYDDMLRHIRSHGFLTMIEDGVRKVLQGITTLEEVRRLV